MRESGVEERLISVIKSMNDGAMTAVKIGASESKKFPVKVVVHQGSVLSPVLYIIVLKALSTKFWKEFPYELRYADDLVLIAESEELLVLKNREVKKDLRLEGLK